MTRDTRYRDVIHRYRTHDVCIVDTHYRQLHVVELVHQWPDVFRLEQNNNIVD